MIYFGFILDFFVNFFLPIHTYFVVGDLDKNRLLPVVFVGILLDFMYHQLFINLVLLLILYIVLKMLKLRNRFGFVKNLLLYTVYFHITYFLFGYSSKYFLAFCNGALLQFLYLRIARKLLK